MQWLIESVNASQEAVPDQGSRFLIGNGYMGIRGTLDEHGREQLAAVNLAGIYDRVGNGWREPLNAPNPLHTVIYVDGKALALPETEAVCHAQSLDFYHAVLRRRTVWQTSKGAVTVESRRFADMAHPHLIGQEYAISVDAPMEIRLLAEIDRDIWEIYGPHYNHMEFSKEKDNLYCLAHVQNGKDQVAVGRSCRLFSQARQRLPGQDAPLPIGRAEEEGAFVYDLYMEPEKSVILKSVCAVYTTNDGTEPLAAVQEALRQEPDIDLLLEAHKEAWEKIWAVGQVELEGDDMARDCVNYSLYHLNCIAPRHRKDLSIPARGLSGQTYKGAVFWDSEMFILDYFLYTQPQIAKSMVRYRIDTLPGALEKAKSYGWQGAFYAWESQEGGFDGCSDYNVTDVFTGRPMRTYFRDKQVHISSAIARAVMLYTEVSGDLSLLTEGGARTVLECARFYYSLLVKRATGDRWEIHDVIGPDEYHERVNNNAYTNKMAAETFRWAMKAAALLKKVDEKAYREFCAQTGAEELLPVLKQAAEQLYVPEPDESGVIPQFDGYEDLEDASLQEVRDRLLDSREYWGGAYGVASQTRIIKQADIVTMLELFHREYSREVLRKNWDYYEPRTEHGSSLSACMYALLACRYGEPDRAYPFFMKSAQADWLGGGKQWAGLVYIGGTHPAAEGGAWKVLAEGFAGLECTENGPVLHPCLPKGWKRVAFRFCCRGRQYLAEVTPDTAEITAL